MWNLNKNYGSCWWFGSRCDLYVVVFLLFSVWYCFSPPFWVAIGMPFQFWCDTDASFSRSPSVSRIRAKMLYATSKDRFRRELDGIHYEIQATDPTEMELEVLRDRAHWALVLKGLGILEKHLGFFWNSRELLFWSEYVHYMFLAEIRYSLI